MNNNIAIAIPLPLLLFILEPLKAIAYQNSGFVYCHITQQIPETPLRALQSAFKEDFDWFRIKFKMTDTVLSSHYIHHRYKTDFFLLVC